MDFVLSEGDDAVLRNLRRAGANAVATNPTVTAPSRDGDGSFQPPVDAGASVREFDRPLWGRRSLWIRSQPGFQPNPEYYRGLDYAPRRAGDLTRQHAGRVGAFLAAAAGAGLRTYFQIGAVQPPGRLRDEDLPRLPSGDVPQNRLAETGSLASPSIRAYNRAYVRDLLEQFPVIDGLRVDWPEYPCYQLDEAFQDFGEPVEAWARERGYDFGTLRAAARNLYHRLTADLPPEWPDAWVRGAALTSREGPFAAVGEWLRLKADLSTDLLRAWRADLAEFGGPQKELSANAFAPPFSGITGFDFARAGEHCDSVSVKLYTMHWGLMVTFWGRAILTHQPHLDAAALCRGLASLFDLHDGEPRSSLSEYGYPLPSEPHPIPDGPQVRKLAAAREALAGRCPTYALVHGYGPPADFERRLRLAWQSAADGVWINRYGYLSDEKLDIVGRVCGAP